MSEYKDVPRETSMYKITNIFWEIFDRYEPYLFIDLMKDCASYEYNKNKEGELIKYIKEISKLDTTINKRAFESYINSLIKKMNLTNDYHRDYNINGMFRPFVEYCRRDEICKNMAEISREILSNIYDEYGTFASRLVGKYIRQ